MMPWPRVWSWAWSWSIPRGKSWSISSVPSHDPRYGMVKDILAGAVLMAALSATAAWGSLSSGRDYSDSSQSQSSIVQTMMGQPTASASTSQHLKGDIGGEVGPPAGIRRVPNGADVDHDARVLTRTSRANHRD